LRNGQLLKKIFPKLGGGHRLAHKANDQLSITAEIIKYDENLALVGAIPTTLKKNFLGLAD
jgi:hypothetical protein